jgi:hypothetical protein
LKAWTKIKPDSELQQKILAAIETQKASAQWSKEGGRFIPFPATWLNDERWEDEAAEALSSHTKLPPLF